MSQQQPRDRAHVDVLRYRYHDADLAADRTGVYGFQASCPCGYRGKRRQIIATAHRDLRDHRDVMHGRVVGQP